MWECIFYPIYDFMVCLPAVRDRHTHTEKEHRRSHPYIVYRPRRRCCHFALVFIQYWNTPLHRGRWKVNKIHKSIARYQLVDKKSCVCWIFISSTHLFSTRYVTRRDGQVEHVVCNQNTLNIHLIDPSDARMWQSEDLDCQSCVYLHFREMQKHSTQSCILCARKTSWCKLTYRQCLFKLTTRV